MNLFGSLFNPSDPMIALAKSGDPSRFVEWFRTAQVFVVFRDSEPEPIGDNEGAFTYGPEGDELLPVFSTEAAAQAFVDRYADLVQRAIPLVARSLEGTALAPILAGRRLGVVLNPLTDEEYEVSREFVAELNA